MLLVDLLPYYGKLEIQNVICGFKINMHSLTQIGQTWTPRTFNFPCVIPLFLFKMYALVNLATIEPNYRLNIVNNLLSRPAIKTLNSCTDKPLCKKAYFTFFLSFEHSIHEHVQFPQ